MELLLALPALLGHAFLWAAFFNHTHGTALPRWFLEPLTIVALVLTVSIPVTYGVWFPILALDGVHTGRWMLVVWLARLYLGVSWIAAAVALARWLHFRVLRRPPALLRHDRSRVHTLLQPSTHSRHFLTRLPGNQALQLDVAERALEVPRLPAALDPITLLHLSDLHFTGRIAKPYFEEAVRIANQFQPDLVAVTGDLVDKPHCIDWIPDTLGKLTARCGVYFILGNHDLWGDTDRLRRTLTDSGLVDLGGRWIEIRVRGEPVVLTGNQLPWIPPAADLQDAPPPPREGGPPRIALAHSPDQLAWARACEVDLLLAGHTHGGQIRLPLVGPILSASHAGARYSSGTFHAPPTIMHVSRGLSAELPLRLHCPPEITKLLLRTTLPPKA